MTLRKKPNVTFNVLVEFLGGTARSLVICILSVWETAWDCIMKEVNTLQLARNMNRHWLTEVLEKLFSHL